MATDDSNDEEDGSDDDGSSSSLKGIFGGGSSSEGAATSDSSDGRADISEGDDSDDRRQINPGDVSAEFRDRDHDVPDGPPPDAESGGEDTPSNDDGSSSSLEGIFGGGSNSEGAATSDDSSSEKADPTDNDGESDEPVPTDDSRTGGRFAPGPTGVGGDFDLDEDETRTVFDPSPQPADELTPEQRDELREEFAEDSPFDAEDITITGVTVGEVEEETPADIQNQFSSGQRRRLRERATADSDVLGPDDIAITGVESGEDEMQFEFATATTELDVETDWFARRDATAELAAEGLEDFDADDIQVTATEGPEEFEVEIRESALRERAAEQDDRFDARDFEVVDPEPVDTRGGLGPRRTPGGTEIRLTDDARIEHVAESTEGVEVDDLSIEDGEVVIEQQEFDEGDAARDNAHDVGISQELAQNIAEQSPDARLEGGQLIFERSADAAESGEEFTVLAIDDDLEGVGDAGERLAGGDGIADTDIPTSRLEQQLAIRDITRDAGHRALSFSLSVPASTAQRIQEIDIEPTAEPSAIAAGALAVAPHPAVRSIGLAVGTAAAAGAAAERFHAPEIEAPQDGDTAVEEITVPVSPGTEATVTEIQAPEETQFIVREIDAPQESVEARQAEISVPEATESTSPTEIQAQPVTAGVLQEGVSEVEEDEDFQRVDDEPTIIREEDIEDTGPLVDIPEIEQERQIREELKRRQQFEREGEQDFTQVRGELPGRIEPVESNIQREADVDLRQVEQVDSSFGTELSERGRTREDIIVGPEVDTDVAADLDTQMDTITDVSTGVEPRVDTLMDVETMTDVATISATDTVAGLDFAQPAEFAQPTEFAHPTEFAQPIQPIEQGVPGGLPMPRLDLDFGDPNEGLSSPDVSSRRREFIFELDVDDVGGDFQI